MGSGVGVQERTLDLARPMTRTAFQPVWLVADMQVLGGGDVVVPDRPDQHSAELLNGYRK